MTSWRDMVGDSRWVIATRNGFEVLRFPVMQSSFSFTYVELLAVPTASLINNPGHLSTGESVFVGKKRLNTMCALENNSKVKAAVEFIDASLHLFGEDSAL